MCSVLQSFVIAFGAIDTGLSTFGLLLTLTLLHSEDVPIDMRAGVLGALIYIMIPSLLASLTLLISAVKKNRKGMVIWFWVTVLVLSIQSIIFFFLLAADVPPWKFFVPFAYKLTAMGLVWVFVVRLEKMEVEAAENYDLDKEIDKAKNKMLDHKIRTRMLPTRASLYEA